MEVLRQKISPNPLQSRTDLSWVVKKFHQSKIIRGCNESLIATDSDSIYIRDVAFRRPQTLASMAEDTRPGCPALLLHLRIKNEQKF